MDFTHNFGAQPQPVQLQMVYQDTRDSSPHWRQDIRVFHPLTEQQFGNRFRVGDRVRMRLTYPNSKMYITPTIVNIVPYYTAQQILGSYNMGDAFKGVPFTRVLVLEP
uniref:Uncharacterized protein n=1 Tax=viral metagenome TaxID=1070528 RepID=A0A6C0ANF1_9ZZZZ